MTGQSMAMGHGPELRAPSGPVSWPELRAHAGVELYVLHVIPHVIPSSDPDTHTVGIINYRVSDPEYATKRDLSQSVSRHSGARRPATALHRTRLSSLADTDDIKATTAKAMRFKVQCAEKCADAAPRIRSQLVPPIIPPRSAHQRQRGGNKRKAVQAPALGYKGRYV